jgi:hypothetical protein
VLEQIRTDLAAKAKAVQARIDELTKALAANVQRERDALMQTRFQADPTPVIDHLRAYVDNVVPLTPLVDRLGKETEAFCSLDGRLELAKLLSMESVRQWGQYLVDSGTGVKGTGADAFRWLWAARLWYSGEALDARLFAFVDQIRPIASASPHHEWRAQLALQRTLARSLPTYVVDRQGASVYRQRSTGDGKADWYYELLKPNDGTRDAGRIERQRVNDDGSLGVKHAIGVSVHNDALFAADKPILEVRTVGDYLRVAQWKPTIVQPLPEQTWARGMNHHVFQQRIAQGLPCLVMETGNTRYWFTPTLGLVRQEITDVFERELCYAAHVR